MASKSGPSGSGGGQQPDKPNEKREPQTCPHCEEYRKRFHRCRTCSKCGEIDKKFGHFCRKATTVPEPICGFCRFEITIDHHCPKCPVCEGVLKKNGRHKCSENVVMEKKKEASTIAIRREKQAASTSSAPAPTSSTSSSIPTSVSTMKRGKRPAEKDALNEKPRRPGMYKKLHTYKYVDYPVRLLKSISSKPHALGNVLFPN